MIDELAERPGFTDRISLQRATEVVAALLSPETYGLLVAGHGWTPQDWSDWVTQHLRADLFPADRAGPDRVHTGRMALACAVIPAPAPIGALTIGVTDAGLALLGFGDHPERAARAADRLGEPLVTDPAATATAAAQLSEYLAGSRRAFELPLDWRLTAGSQRRVLQALLRDGAVRRHRHLRRAGRRAAGSAQSYTAARGVGSIMGSNPMPVVVPVPPGAGRRRPGWLRRRAAHQGVPARSGRRAHRSALPLIAPSHDHGWEGRDPVWWMCSIRGRSPGACRTRTCGCCATPNR